MHLPDHLYARLDLLGSYAPIHPRLPECAAALTDLRAVLASGEAAGLPDALRGISRAYARDVAGQIIPLRHNWVRRTAGQLETEVERWLSEEAGAAA